MVIVFFFNDTATTEIYTLSLHDALPIWIVVDEGVAEDAGQHDVVVAPVARARPTRQVAVPDLRQDRPSLAEDRKSTRLNSSHANISYAVFCLKKKKTENEPLKSTTASQS